MDPIKRYKQVKKLKQTARAARANAEYKLKFCKPWQWRRKWVLKHNIKVAEKVINMRNSI